MSPFLSVISESWYSVELFSCVQLFMTPWTAAHQASLSITNSHSWLKLMSIKSVMPSSHLSLCHPLFLLPSIFVYKKRLPYITYLWESVSPIYLSRWYFWSTSYVSGTVPDLEGERWTIQRKSPPWETCILDGKHFTYKYTKGIGVLEMLFRRSKQGEKEKLWGEGAILAKFVQGSPLWRGDIWAEKERILRRSVGDAFQVERTTWPLSWGERVLDGVNRGSTVPLKVTECSILGSGRSSGEVNGNPLQHSCLENSMDRGAWRAVAHELQRLGHDWATNTFTFISGSNIAGWGHWLVFFAHLGCADTLPSSWFHLFLGR